MQGATKRGDIVGAAAASLAAPRFSLKDDEGVLVAEFVRCRFSGREIIEDVTVDIHAAELFHDHWLAAAIQKLAIIFLELWNEAQFGGEIIVPRGEYDKLVWIARPTLKREYAAAIVKGLGLFAH